MANFNISTRTAGTPLAHIGDATPAGVRRQCIIGTPTQRGNHNAWAIDLSARQLRHHSGLRIRFVRRAGDWYPVVLLPVPAQIGAAAIGGLTRAAMEKFLDALMETKDVANNRAAALYR